MARLSRLDRLARIRSSSHHPNGDEYEVSLRMVTTGSKSTQGEIARLLKEAELYEAQGLYSAAQEVYRNILAKEPGNRKAREKLTQFRESQVTRTAPDKPPRVPEDLSPRIAFDLGLAYMGMNLHAEALDEFRKALKGAPAFRADLCRHIANCLIHIEKYEEAQRFLAQVLVDRNLTGEQKNEITNDTVGIYLELGLFRQAREFLERLPDEHKGLVRNYDRLVQELVSLSLHDEELEVVVEDEDTGEIYTVTQRVQRVHSPHVSPATSGPPVESRPENVSKRPAKTASEPEPRARPTKAPQQEIGAPSRVSESQPAVLTEEVRTPEEIPFACVCGKVHGAPIESVGDSVLCLDCGRHLAVPAADTKRDLLSTQILGKTVGGCRILYRIGGGGMGGVFKGHHLGLDIPVAVKILHSYLAERDPVFVKRFVREARANAKLQHPNIVGVLNVGYEGGVHFLVMPYVGGGSAADKLEKVGRLPVPEVLDIALQVARALKLAEENNITHRDIKPANILFTEKGEAKIADLGLARNYLETAEAGLTQTGIACGTPLYFSPEQARGAKDLDIRSDIYSLGITLYHLLEGVPPFLADSAYVIFQKHVSEQLPPFKNAQPPVPESLFKLIQKMTAKKREDRLQNVQQLIEALEQVRNEVSSVTTGRHRKSLLERLGIIRGQ